MRKIVIWLKWPLFLAILIGSLLGIQTCFRVNDDRVFQSEVGFYQEEAGTLDAVYVGSSSVYAFWQAPIAWETYGIAVYPYTSPAMPASAIRWVVEEARKTQPDALYVISLNVFKDVTYEENRIHFLVDYMPFSMTKVKLIETLTKDAGITGLSKLEYYFPLIRFHSAWSELTTKQIRRTINGLKGAVSYDSFLTDILDCSKRYLETDSQEPLDEEELEILEELLIYLEKEKVKVLFVVSPQIISDESILAQLNTIQDLVRDRGFDVLPAHQMLSQIGLNPAVDYYNTGHTNVHGSLKFTYFLGQYLSETYGWEKKPTEGSYESWMKASAMYEPLISANTMDFERKGGKRDFTLPSAKMKSCQTDGQTLTVRWYLSSGADGYLVYRKEKPDGFWERIGQTDADTKSFEDQSLDPQKEYKYTVVPIRQEGQETLYGNFSYKGVNGSLE